MSKGTVVSVLDLFPLQMQHNLEVEMQPAKEDKKEKLYFIIRFLKKLRKRLMAHFVEGVKNF